MQFPCLDLLLVLRSKDLMPSIFTPEPIVLGQPIVYRVPDNSSSAGRGSLISGTRRVVPTSVAPECLAEEKLRIETEIDACR